MNGISYVRDIYGSPILAGLAPLEIDVLVVEQFLQNDLHVQFGILKALEQTPEDIQKHLDPIYFPLQIEDLDPTVGLGYLPLLLLDLILDVLELALEAFILRQGQLGVHLVFNLDRGVHLILDRIVEGLHQVPRVLLRVRKLVLQLHVQFMVLPGLEWMHLITGEPKVLTFYLIWFLCFLICLKSS